jgi:hypothetical protein
MWQILKDLRYIFAVIAALVAVAWFSDPAEHYLMTGRSCHEITQRLASKGYRSLSPAEATDLANCVSP